MSCLSLCTLLLSWSLTTAPSLLWQPEFKLLALYHNNNTENNNNVYARDCSKSLTFIILFSILTPSLWGRLCYFLTSTKNCFCEPSSSCYSVFFPSPPVYLVIHPPSHSFPLYHCIHFTRQRRKNILDNRTARTK